MENSEDRAKLNKRLLAIALVAFIAACFFVTAVSFAAYTHSTRAQRTIAAYDDSGVSFSSNCLSTEDLSSSGKKPAYASSADGEAYTVVTVCNHEQGKSTYHTNDITYTLTATLVKSYGVGAYQNATAVDVGSYTVDITHGGVRQTLNSETRSCTFALQTIATGAAHTDSYSVNFSAGWAGDEPDLYLKIVVTADGFENLQGIIQPAVRAQSMVTSWSGVFTDEEGTGAAIPSYAPYKYDGYNYVISGTGAGTFTLKWNSDMITLSAVSLNDINADLTARGESTVTVTTSGSISTISFPVDSSDTGRYEVVFYKKDIDPEISWATGMNEQLTMPSLTLTKVAGYYFG